MPGESDSKIPAGWALDTREGWKWIAYRYCYFSGGYSRCGKWGPVSTFGRPRRGLLPELTEAQKAEACAKCLGVSHV